MTGERAAGAFRGESRRRFIAIAMAAPLAGPAFAAGDAGDGKLEYRGFVVDLSAVAGAANVEAIEASVRHQIDIVADCGARPGIIDFFRGRRIALARGLPEPPGRFIPNHGVDIEAGLMPEQEPIILHELLHAYHYYVLPGGFQNPDVLGYYNHAKDSQLYPATERHKGRPAPTYILTSHQEFFAVTASLYLWGQVDREPYNRARLKSLQPFYYEWLGRQFGVQK
jgi:hypothetical protein